MTNQYLSRQEAAQYLCSLGAKITFNTLGTYASRRKGPRYFKQGVQTLYTKADLDNWFGSRMSVVCGTADSIPAE